MDHKTIDLLSYDLHQSSFSKRVAATLAFQIYENVISSYNLELLKAIVPRLLSGDSIAHEEDKQIIYDRYAEFDENFRQSMLFI
jgi:hypothetical protein